MSLWVAVPCALGAAGAYGAATGLQHSTVHRAEARSTLVGLLVLLREPRWLLSVGGDAVGLALQVAALATGPVVLIQPLLVLALPVALPIGWLMGGGPRPRRGDVVAVLGIVIALAVFFGLVGDPGRGREPRAVAVGVAVVVLLTVSSAAVIAPIRPAAIRAAGLGTAAGAGFGLVGVLINGVTVGVERRGWAVLTGGPGLAALVGVLVVGGAAVALTQLSFRVGELRASFPANESAAPLVAVALGAALLHEHVPAGPGHLLGYAVCAVAIVVATIRLAGVETGRGGAIQS